MELPGRNFVAEVVWSAGRLQGIWLCEINARPRRGEIPDRAGNRDLHIPPPPGVVLSLWAAGRGRTLVRDVFNLVSVSTSPGLESAMSE